MFIGGPINVGVGWTQIDSDHATDKDMVILHVDDPVVILDEEKRLASGSLFKKTITPKGVLWILLVDLKLHT